MTPSPILRPSMRNSHALTAIPEWLFPTLTLVILVGIPTYAAVMRGRFYAIFSVIILGFASAGAFSVYESLGGWLPNSLAFPTRILFLYGMIAMAVHYLMLVHARMRGPLYRGLISLPGQVFLASSFMAAFWMLLLLVVRLPLLWLGADGALAWLMPLDAVPYIVGIAAAFTSARPRGETVHVRVGDAQPEDFSRLPITQKPHRAQDREADSPLRIIQLSDTHLGPWQSVERLRSLIRELISHDPDLVLLTGDFLTMESNATPGALEEALSPLAAIQERCFAIFGNHDHEAPDEVRSGLAANGITLLVDEAVVAETRTGPIQIIGADYVGKGRKEHLETLLGEHPRTGNQPRMLLLHDPSAFHDLPEDDVDLVFSGHTHGGQVGLVSLGFSWTVLNGSRWPDHGHFARGRSHLYVHRGTGFYGFPLRIGVPGEASVLEIEWAGSRLTG